MKYVGSELWGEWNREKGREGEGGRETDPLRGSRGLIFYSNLLVHRGYWKDLPQSQPYSFSPILNVMFKSKAEALPSSSPSSD